MKIFEYQHMCNVCGEMWEQRRLQPYKIERHIKTCPECLEKHSLTQVNDLGGLDGDESCEGCKHFQPVDRGLPVWGKCGRGNRLQNEYEYTLTHAIDNAVGCLVEPKEHETYGEDVLGLVYSKDVCKEYEEGT